MPLLPWPEFWEWFGPEREVQDNFFLSTVVLATICGLLSSVLALISRRFVIAAIGAATFVILPVVVPSTLKSCCGAAENAPISHLRTINTAEVTYLSSSGGRYGTINDLISAGLLDSKFTTPVSGYVFEIQVSGSGYTATAMPRSTKLDKYGYYSGTDAVVRYALSATDTCQPCFPDNQSGLPVQ